MIKAYNILIEVLLSRIFLNVSKEILLPDIALLKN